MLFTGKQKSIEVLNNSSKLGKRIGVRTTLRGPTAKMRDSNLLK